MFTVNAPLYYQNQPDILENSAERIKTIGKRAFVVSGSKSHSLVKPLLLDRLANVNVSYEIGLFAGQCTAEEIDSYAQQAGEQNSDFIIGIGGGKALDLSKAVGDKLEIPVVTVPTVPATCAAWSALTILYDDEGRVTGNLRLNRSPVLLLSDTRILASAPKRYLAAGIGDTLVKWYETAINISGKPGELGLRTGVETAKLALDVLHRNALEAYAAAGTGEVTPAFVEATDAILILAGLSGSIVDVSDSSSYVALAHAIHNSLTQLPDTHGTLHGEKVAFGLLAHVILENKTDEEVIDLAVLLRKLGLPLTLRELGITGNAAEYAERIARGVGIESAAEILPFAANVPALTEAILKADQLGRELHQKSAAGDH